MANFDFWTAARTNTLLKMAADKKTAQEAAKALGTTRDAVIGKSHRLGVSFSPPLEEVRRLCSEAARRAWSDPTAKAARLAKNRAKRRARAQ